MRSSMPEQNVRAIHENGLSTANEQRLSMNNNSGNGSFFDNR